MKISKWLKESTIFVALVLLVIFFSLTSRNFFSANNFINIINQVVVLGIMAFGETFVLISGGLDISVGAQISVSNIVMGTLMVNMGMPPAAAILLGILLCGLIGLVNGLLVNKVGIFSMIATLAMMQICQGVSYTICKGKPISGFVDSVKVIGQNRLLNIPIPVYILLILFVICLFVLNKCYFGRFFYAVGGNGEAARLSGLPTVMIKIIAYVICGLFTGIASFLTLSRLNTALPQSGVGEEMDVITAVVLGGVSMNGGEGRLSGVLVGVLIMGILSNGMVLMGANNYVQMIIKGLVLLLSLSLDQMKRISVKRETA